MTQFSMLNMIVLVGYIAGMLCIGAYFARRQKTTEDFFLAGRAMPWGAVAMSMYASVTSAMTFMALPGMAFRENISLLVVCLISPLVAPFLILLFYPRYRRHGVTTSYEFISHRFGKQARAASALLFIFARLGWLGTVIYAPALSLHVTTGIPVMTAALIIGILATVYCVMGGLSAVVWTDVPQFLIMIGGILWLVTTLHLNVDGGLAGILEIAHVSEKIGLFDWHLHPLEMTAGAVVLSYFFVMLYDYGVDQVTVQRLMSVRSDRGVSKAILFNAVTDFFVIGMLLLIGLGMFVFYQQHPGQLAEGIEGDRVLPFFIIQQLPDGISGLLVAALFAAAMSSVDSGLNSITTVILHDVIRPFSPTHRPVQIRTARILNALLGLLATTIALIVTARIAGLFEMFLTFMGLFSGPVLALFLLGMFSRKASFKGWLAGAASGIAAVLLVKEQGWLMELYFFPLSTLVTLTLGWMASHRLPDRPQPVTS